MARSSKIAGVTLLEIMLVLAIGASFIVMGGKLYQMLLGKSNVTDMQYNVDHVFIAAARYYQANCKPQRDPITGVIQPGTGELAPTDTYEPPDPFPVPVSQLISDGYMTTTLPRNPIIDNTGPNKGYVVQFNLAPPTKKTMITDTTPLTTEDVGNIVMWRIQVSVKVANRAMAQTYMKMLNANCTSQLTGSIVQPCSAAGAGGDYLVWERLPSFASPEANPAYITTNAAGKEFVNQYEVAPVMYSVGANTANKQNYLCGS